MGLPSSVKMASLGLNPAAWWAVADRLAQAEGRWQAFDRKGALRAVVFPDPDR